MIINEKGKRHFIEDLLGSKARIKILKVLALNDELNISLIISKTKLNHSNVIKHLNFLKSFNLIQEKKFGRIKIYRYKSENIKASGDRVDNKKDSGHRGIERWTYHSVTKNVTKPVIVVSFYRDESGEFRLSGNPKHYAPTFPSFEETFDRRGEVILGVC